MSDSEHIPRTILALLQSQSDNNKNNNNNNSATFFRLLNTNSETLRATSARFDFVNVIT